LLLAVGAAGGGAALAVASIPDQNGVIHACYALAPGSTLPTTTPGNLRIIDPTAGQTCSTGNPAGGPPGEATLSWNTAGPPGATGAQGLPGATGPKGPPGNVVTISGQTFSLSNGRTLTITDQPTIAPLLVSSSDKPIGTLTVGTGRAALSFDILAWGFAPTGSTQSHGSGGGAGKVKFNEFTIKKTTDKSSPLLFQKCATGEHIPKAVLFIRKAGAGKSAVYTFTNVLISSYQSGGHGHSDPTPVESVSLNFTKIEVKYEPQEQK
jgi:type VI secretion system secreted protein Hcp